MSITIPILPLILLSSVYIVVISGSATRVLWLKIAYLNSFFMYIRGGSYHGGVIKALIVFISCIFILLKIHRLIFYSGLPSS